MPKSLPNFLSLADVVADLERKRAAIDERTVESAKARKSITEKIGAIRRVKEFVGRPLEEIEGDAEAVRAEVVRKVGDGWASFAIGAKGTWNNVLSNITTGIEAATGRKYLHHVRRSDYPADWDRLVKKIEVLMEDGTLDEFAMIKLRSLFSPAIALGISPTDLDQDAFDRVLEQKRNATRAELGVSPWTYASAIVRAAGFWNNHVRRLVISNNPPDLFWECHRPERYLTRDELAPELRAELDRIASELRMENRPSSVSESLRDKLKARLAMADIEKLRGLQFVAETKEEAKKKSKKPVSDHYIESYELAIRATVSSLIKHMPGAKASDFKSLRMVCNPDGMTAMIQELTDRIDAGKNMANGKTRLVYGEHLIDIGKRFAGTPRKELDEMREWLSDPDICVGENCMTPQRREDVDAMLENKPLYRWLTISDILWATVEKALDRVDAARKRGEEDELTQGEISLAEVAIVSGILRIIPLRRKNLTLLRYKGPGPTLVIPTNPHRPMKIRVPHQEMKVPIPGKNVAAWCDENLAKRIRIYIEKIRPFYIKIHSSEGVQDNEFLFPGKSSAIKGFSGHRHPDALADAFSRRMKDEGMGLMEFHIARHVTASVLVRANYRNLPLVAKLLGNSVRTSEFYYVSDDAEGASMRYHRILQKLVPGLKALYTATIDDNGEEGFFYEAA
jgi:integrase